MSDVVARSDVAPVTDRRPPRTTTVLAAALVVLAGVAGCTQEPDRLDAGSAQRQIKEAVAATVAPPVIDVECPTKIPLAKGEHFDCDVQLGEPSGVKLLKDMLATEMDDAVRIQIAESRWRLGDVDAVEALCRGLVSNYVDDQMLAIMALTAPKDRRVEGYVRGKLTDPYTEIALVAARGMGDLGYDAGYPIAMKSIRSPDSRQRFLAAYALGSIGRSDAQSSTGCSGAR